MENNLTNQAEPSLALTGDQIYNYAAHLLINGDKNSYEVKTALISKGVPESEATYVIEQLEQQIEEARSKKANKDMLYGGLWFAGGTLVTIFTYSAASNGGGSYVVAWGAILFGGIQFVKGLMASTK